MGDRLGIHGAVDTFYWFFIMTLINSIDSCKGTERNGLDCVFGSQRSLKCINRVLFGQLGLGQSSDLSKRPSLTKLDSLLQEVCITVGQSRVSWSDDF